MGLRSLRSKSLIIAGFLAPTSLHVFAETCRESMERQEAWDFKRCTVSRLSLFNSFDRSGDYDYDHDHGIHGIHGRGGQDSRAHGAPRLKKLSIHADRGLV